MAGGGPQDLQVFAQAALGQGGDHAAGAAAVDPEHQLLADPQAGAAPGLLHEAFGPLRRADQQVGAEAFDGEIALGFQLPQPLQGGGGDGVDGAGIEEGARRQFQGVGFVLEGAPFHRRPVLVEAGAVRGGVQQAHSAPEQVAEEGTDIGVTAADLGGPVPLLRADQHRRQGRRWHGLL